MDPKISTSELWCQGEFRLQAEGFGQSRRVELRQPFARLGTLQGCDLHLGGPGMPRRVLYLHGTRWGVFALPLVPSDRFAPIPRGWLPFRGRLHVGPYRLTWEWQPEIGARANAPEDAAPPDLLGRGSLEKPRELDILVDARPYGRCQLTRRLTLVGRKPPCHLIFTSRTISSCHFLIVAEGQQLWVVDLASGNLTLLDGIPVTAGAWPPGSSVTVGRVTLVLPAPPQTAVEQFENAQPLELAEARDKVLPLHSIVEESEKGPASPEVISAANGSHAFREAGPGDSAWGLPPGMAGPLATSSERPTPIAVEKQQAKIGDFATEPSPAGPSGMISSGESPVPCGPTGQSMAPLNSITGEDSGEWAEKTADRGGSTFGQAVDQDGPYTEILVEERMQDDRGAAWAKDFVLSLFASGGLEGSLSFEETSAEIPTQGSQTSGELGDVSEKTVTTHEAVSPAPGELAPLEAKERELACKEQLLSEWARSLDEMSETLLRLQEELVAEEDKFAEEKQKLLGEAKRLETAWQDYHNALENLRRREAHLAEREKKLAEQLAAVEAQQAALQERLSHLGAWERRLREWEDELKLRQERLSRASGPDLAAQPARETSAPEDVTQTPVVVKNGRPELAPSPTQGQWLPSGLPLPYRRWRLPKEILIGGALAVIAGVCVWTFCPRSYTTLHRLSLFELPWLVAVRDGQCPAEMPPEIFPVNGGLWPDSPQVEDKLREDSQINHLPLVKKKGLSWLLDAVEIGRTEGLPYITWYLVCGDRASSQKALERWQEVYWTELATTVRKRMQSALVQCEEKRKPIADELNSLNGRREELTKVLGTSDPRQAELQARKNLQLAEMAEKELAQLTQEIDLHRKKLGEVQAVLRDPASFVSADELHDAVLRRLTEGAAPVAEVPVPAPDRLDAARVGAGFQNSASAAVPPEAPPSNAEAVSPSPEAKLEVLREIVKRELATAKKEEATLLAQGLSTELERLQTRRDQLQQQIAESQATATRLTQQAGELRQISVRLAELEREAARWNAIADTLKKMLRELDNPPRGETVQSVRRPYLPAGLALLTAGLILGSALVVRTIRERQSAHRLVIHWIDEYNEVRPTTGGVSPRVKDPASSRGAETSNSAHIHEEKSSS